MLGKDIIENLLLLLNTESFSKKEEDVAKMLVDFIPTIGFETHQDEVGNVYGVRGTTTLYPMLNAHMDSVEGYKYSSTSTYSAIKPRTCQWCANAQECWGVLGYNLPKDTKDFSCGVDYKEQTYYTYEKEKVITSVKDETEEEKKVVAKIVNGKIVGNGSRPIGGDDKCGIAMALQIAMDNPDMPLKLFFSVGEEIGCVGVRHAVKHHRSFFEDVLYSVTIDRRGSRDLCISSSSGRNGRNSFMRQLSDAYWAVNIIPNYVDGSSADVVCIREVVYDCVNISCGYEDPHTCNETVVIDNFMQLYTMLNHFVNSFKVVESVHTRAYVPPKVVETAKPTVLGLPDVKKKPNENTKMDNNELSTNVLSLSYYSNKNTIKVRNKILAEVAKLKKNNYKGVKFKFSLEENYEGVVDILEYLMPEVYNNTCLVKISGKNPVHTTGFLGMHDGKIVIIVPINSEVDTRAWCNNDKLGTMFYNLFW